MLRIQLTSSIIFAQSKGIKSALLRNIHGNKANWSGKEWDLREASLNPEDVTHLNLSGNKMFVCSDMMCGHFGGSCVCKLARWLEQTGPRLTKLTNLSLSHNQLNRLPDSLWKLPALSNLDLSNNSLQEVPIGGLLSASNLKSVDLSGNDKLMLCKDSLKEALDQHKRLQKVYFDDGVLCFSQEK
eukprot:m.176659 g.176659  ORF g.176659 m.176659 type:complete len:185 (-) comp15446_c0_seq11:2616-3170(-)